MGDLATDHRGGLLVPSLQQPLECSRRSQEGRYIHGWGGRRRPRVRAPRQDFRKLIEMSVLMSGKGQNTGRGFEVQESARIPKGLGETMVRGGP